MPVPIIPIIWSSPAREPEARELAARFGLPIADDDAPDQPRLVLAQEGLSLRAGDLSMRVDFLSGPLAHRIAAGSHNAFRSEALIQAVSIRKPGRATQAIGRDSDAPTIIDVTAGLGRDSILLALAGFRVIAIEKHPAVATLLQDGLARALADDALAARLDGRLSLRFGDAVDLLPQLPAADAIYLDPMFPQRSKSALVKKEMQLLQLLHDADDESANEARLLDAALAHPAVKVIVKRPRLAPPLAGREPAFTRIDKTMRYDIYHSPSA